MPKTCMAALAVLWLCGACAGEAGGDRSDTPAAAPVPPPNAIRVGDDYYMVPTLTDASGCQQYAAWSSRRGVPAAVYYRKPDGEFTLYRSDTGCAGDDAR